MRKLIPISVVLLGLAVAAAYGITEKQNTVAPVLDSLKFEYVQAKGENGQNVIGGPQTYKVTQKTIDLLTKLLKDGGTITVEGDGSIKINEKGK